MYHNGVQVFSQDLPYVATFSAVPIGKPLLYLNSLMQLSVALNQGSLAEQYHIGSGTEWSIEVFK